MKIGILISALYKFYYYYYEVLLLLFTMAMNLVGKVSTDVLQMSLEIAKDFSIVMRP